MKVLTVVGARPQFVKAFAVSRELRRSHTEVLVHTGQHYDEELSGVFFEELDIPAPDYNLGVGSASHARQTAEMVLGLEDAVEAESPDAILVYGDTNSTLAGALVGAKRDATLVHVEAGLRSHNWSMPEEVNRVLTDHASDVLCAPTAAAVDALGAEGREEGVVQTGDVMYDTLLWARDRATARSDVLERLGLEEGEFVLATVHRAGNTDDPDRLAGIVDGLAAGSLPTVVPLHPRTRDRLLEFDLFEAADRRLTLVDPVGYLDFVRLVDAADRVATDSGGVQKEAFFLDTPCVTMREETEWTETVTAGWNVLVGADPAAIGRALEQDVGATPTKKPSPYGDGNAAEAVVSATRRAVVGAPGSRTLP
jgi:UDP-N-acetylglucosamine 2-epimerase (non-hydrolysing)